MNKCYIINDNRQEILVYEGKDVNVGLQKLIDYYNVNRDNTRGYLIYIGEKPFIMMPCDNMNKILKILEKILY